MELSIASSVHAPRGSDTSTVEVSAAAASSHPTALSCFRFVVASRCAQRLWCSAESARLGALVGCCTVLGSQSARFTVGHAIKGAEGKRDASSATILHSIQPATQSRVPDPSTLQMVNFSAESPGSEHREGLYTLKSEQGSVERSVPVFEDAQLKNHLMHTCRDHADMVDNLVTTPWPERVFSIAFAGKRSRDRPSGQRQNWSHGVHGPGRNDAADARRHGDDPGHNSPDN